MTPVFPLATRSGRRNNGIMKATPRPVDVRRSDFEELYQRHSREVWALAYARWMNADTAMDITQESFLRLWKQLDTGEIADLLGINATAVHMRLSRARQRLAERLKVEGVGETP